MYLVKFYMMMSTDHVIIGRRHKEKPSVNKSGNIKLPYTFSQNIGHKDELIVHLWGMVPIISIICYVIYFSGS